MTDLPITLTEQEWNVVLQALGDLPFRVSAPLIQRIQSQAAAVRAPSSGDVILEDQRTPAQGADAINGASAAH